MELQRQRAERSAFDNADGRHLRVAIDLSYLRDADTADAAAIMTRYDASSLALQLHFLVKHNRKAEHPACLYLTSADPRLVQQQQQQQHPDGEEKAEATDGSAAGRAEHHQAGKAAISAVGVAAASSTSLSDAFVSAMTQHSAHTWLLHRSEAPLHSALPGKVDHQPRTQPHLSHSPRPFHSRNDLWSPSLTVAA